MPGYPPATSTTPISDTRKTERNTQLGFAYTTPCLVTGGSHCNWLSFLIISSMSQFLASLASCTTVTVESVSSVLMAATSLSGVTLHYNVQRTRDTQYVQARPPAGPVPPTPPQTGPGPPAWTCASLTPAPSTPRSLQCRMC